MLITVLSCLDRAVPSQDVNQRCTNLSSLDLDGIKRWQPCGECFASCWMQMTVEAAGIVFYSLSRLGRRVWSTLVVGLVEGDEFEDELE